jgi:predicted MPP superfamily phosphohydrolase
MRVTWSTDLHLNFLRSKRDRLKFYHSVKDENPDVYVVTGDIGTAQDFAKYLDEMGDVLGSTPIYFNLGNHDFYHCYSIKETRDTAHNLSRTRSIHYLQNM